MQVIVQTAKRRAQEQACANSMNLETKMEIRKEVRAFQQQPSSESASYNSTTPAFDKPASERTQQMTTHSFVLCFVLVRANLDCDLLACCFIRRAEDSRVAAAGAKRRRINAIDVSQQRRFRVCFVTAASVDVAVCSGCFLLLDPVHKLLSVAHLPNKRISTQTLSN